MGDLILREASPDDSEFAYLVKKAAFRGYIERVWGWDEECQRELHQRRFASQDFRVIQSAGIDVGILAIERRPDCLKVNQLFIMPDHQGRGIGTACMRVIIEEAQTRRISIRLQVLKVNSRAIAFYRRLGFTPIDENATHVQMERAAIQ